MRRSFLSRSWIGPAATAAAIGLFPPVASASEGEFVKSSINLPVTTIAFKTDFDLDGDGLNDALAVYQRRLMIFFQKSDGHFSAAPDIEIGAEQPIPASYAAVAVGKVSVGAGAQILLIGPEGVDFLDIARLRSAGTQPVSPQKLISHSLSITPGPALEYLDCALDMDGDGHIDIVLPSDNDLLLFASRDGAPYALQSRVPLNMQTQQNTSLETEPSLLGSALFTQGEAAGSNVVTLPELNLWHSVQFSTVRYSLPIMVADYNMDRRFDFLSASRIRYQDPDGNFKSVDSGVYKRISSSYVPRESQNTLVSIPNLLDFNGDGILDTYQVEATAAKLSPRTDISIFLGRRDRTFAEKADMVLRTRDFAYSDSLPVGDINGDGAEDLALFHLDFQPSSMQSQLKSYLRNGLEGELRFYLWDKAKNQYPASPAFRQPVLVNYEIYGARQFFRQQVTINQEMDGDNLPDLVLKTGAEEFSIFHNNKGTGYSNPAEMVIATSPTHFSSLKTTDLNGDKKGDVIVSGYLEGQDDRVIYSLYVSH